MVNKNKKVSNTKPKPQWGERADELNCHGVPEQRANVVALRELGLTYAEIAAELELGSNNNDRSQVSRHLKYYREQRRNAEWLVANTPKILQTKYRANTQSSTDGDDDTSE